MDPHPGIRIDRIPVRSNFAGLLFAIGTVILFAIGVPALRSFLLVGLAGGVLVGAFRWWQLRGK